jgi:hypothetical protein
VTLRYAIYVGIVGLTLPFLGPSSSQRQARLQDLAYARENYVSVSHAFSPSARQEALNLIRNLEERAGELSDLDLLMGMRRVTALARNAHDDMRLGEGAWSPPSQLPLHIIWFPDAMVIARAGPPALDLLGAQITAIEGLPPGVLFARLAPLCGGSENYCLWNLAWAIESQGVLAALGIAKSPDQLRFNLVLPNGDKVERMVAMVPSKDVPSLRPTRLWSGELSADEAARGWRAAIDPQNEPIYLRDADDPFRLVELPALDAWYVQFRVNRDWGSHRIQSFAEQVSATLKARARKNLVVDLRFDVGGDITLTRALMSEIPKEVTGRIYLLVGRYTFSAGIVASAILKYYGQNRVSIVGEGVGDRLRWWSEGHSVCLPNSHICLGMTDGLWDLTKGCTGEPACYGDRIVGPIGSLDPRISAPLTAAAWLSRNDPAMARVEAELKENGR